MNEILLQKTAMSILLYFIEHPGVYSQRELIARIPLSKATAVKWLNILVVKQFLVLHKIGPTHQYALHTTPFIEKLREVHALA